MTNNNTWLRLLFQKKRRWIVRSRSIVPFKPAVPLMIIHSRRRRVSEAEMKAIWLRSLAAQHLSSY